jgi:hypothetical protein
MNKVMRLLLRALPAFAILCVATAADARPKPCPGADPAIDVVYVELTRVDGNVLLATLKDPVTGALSRELEIRKGEKGWFLDLAQWRTNIPFEVTRSTLRDGLRPERAGYVFSSWTPPDGIVTELEPAAGGGTRCAAHIAVDGFRRWTLQVAATPDTFHIPAFCNGTCTGKETAITATLDETSHLRIIMNKDTVCSFPVEVNPRDPLPKTISHKVIITSLPATCTVWRTMEFVRGRLIPQEIVVKEAGK